MNSKLYPKLACVNMKNNKRMYGPYLLASVITVSMLYIMVMLTGDKGVNSLPGAASLSAIMFFGCITIVIFSVIFLFYTNSFLMKQRKKEIGLYNILGMEKKHIGFVLLWETIISAGISMIGGILTGVLFYDLVLMILYKILNTKMNFTFHVSLSGIQFVIVIYAVIFTLTLLFNLFQIHLANPINLLHGGEVGEKEPKTKWVSTVLGIICLGAGYYLALTTESPITAIGIFFIAVILVIFGTYFLFSACSIAILKALRRKKTYYYQKKHFTNISGMIYRMKQNAAGLANICILSTMVLVTLSTTVCMYLGSDESLSKTYPRDFCMVLNINDQFKEDEFVEQVQKLVSDKGFQMKDIICQKYDNLVLAYDGTGYTIPKDDQSYSSLVSVDLYTTEEFEILTGVKLNEPNHGEMFRYGEFEADTIEILGQNYKTQRLDLTDSNAQQTMDELHDELDTSIVLVTSQEMMTELEYQAVQNNSDSNYYSKYYKFYFNTSGNNEEKENLYKNARFEENINLSGTESFYVSSKQANEQDYYGTYGGFLFLGIILGSLFLMVTVVIIYYKQISEGYEDRYRFQIMKKVGMSETEVRQSIRSQILKVFFLPVGVATIHVAFAFKLITKMLQLFNLHNIRLSILCTLGTIGIFTAVYVIVYLITARVYYKIVDEK